MSDRRRFHIQVDLHRPKRNLRSQRNIGRQNHLNDRRQNACTQNNLAKFQESPLRLGPSGIENFLQMRPRLFVPIFFQLSVEQRRSIQLCVTIVAIDALRLVFALTLGTDAFGHPLDSFFGLASAVLAGVGAGAPFASLLPAVLSLPLPLSLLGVAAGASFFAPSL